MQNNFYNQQNYGFNPFNNFEIIFNHKKSIKKHSTAVGVCILVFLAAPYVTGIILSLTGLFDVYENNLSFGYAAELIMNVLALFVPFYIVYKTTSKENKALIEKSLDKPVSTSLAVSSVFFGLMLCFAGDYISYYISVLFESVGITLTSSPEQVIPTSGTDMFLFIFSMVVPPAIIEEFTLRSVTMQPLRKYGEVFAIVTSAVVFALMHRNAVQGIFAFIAGLVLGYIAVSTNSVWPTVIIHALNNASSAVTSILNETNEEFANNFYAVLVSVVFVLGLISAIPFFKNKRRISIKRKPQILSVKDKTQSFFLTLPMIVSIIIMVIYTVFGEM